MRRAGCICAVALWLALAGGPAAAQCLAFSGDIARVWSASALEDRLAAHLAANARRFGRIDWDCLDHAFSVLSPATAVAASRDGAGGAVYRFTVDRRGNPLVMLGGSDGVFTATVRVTGAGRVGLVGQGGRTRWLTSGGADGG